MKTQRELQLGAEMEAKFNDRFMVNSWLPDKNASMEFIRAYKHFLAAALEEQRKQILSEVVEEVKKSKVGSLGNSFAPFHYLQGWEDAYSKIIKFLEQLKGDK